MVDADEDKGRFQEFEFLSSDRCLCGVSGAQSVFCKIYAWNSFSG